MKRAVLLWVVFFVSLSGVAEIQLNIFKAKLQQQLAVHEKATTSMMIKTGAAYLADLERIKARVQTEGSLEKTMQTIAEIKRFEEKWSMPAALSKLPEIGQAQGKYTAAAGKIQRASAIQTQRLLGQYDRALDGLQKVRVREGKLDEATAIKAERSRVKTTQLLQHRPKFKDEIALKKVPAVNLAAKPPLKSTAKKEVFRKNDSNKLLMSASKIAPVVNGEDIANLGAANYDDKFWVSKVAAGMPKGQTFTTNRTDVYLKSITYRVSATQKAEPTKSYKIRIGKVSGKATNVMFSGTATQDFIWNADEYMTWSLARGLLLSANTTYSIDIQMTSSTSEWQSGIPYLQCSADEYPGGQYYSNQPPSSELKLVSKRDRIFHLDLDRHK